MNNVLDQAQNFNGGPVAAARKRDSWARKEANATDSEQRAQYREAIADLEARYPDIEDVPIGGAEAFARERGHGTGARSPVHGGRSRQRPGNTQRAPSAPKPSAKGRPRSSSQPKGSGTPGLDPGARRSPTQRRAAKGRPTPRVDRSIRQTGIAQAAEAGYSTTMAALGATVGLALLYLVLSSAEKPGTGAAALPSMISTVTSALGRFLSLADVFPGSGAAPRVIPPGKVEGAGGKLEPEGPAGAYNKRVEAGEVAGPPTPRRILQRERRRQQQRKARERR